MILHSDTHQVMFVSFYEQRQTTGGIKDNKNKSNLFDKGHKTQVKKRIYYVTPLHEIKIL